MKGLVMIQSTNALIFCGNELPRIPHITQNILNFHEKVVKTFDSFPGNIHPLREIIKRIAYLASAIFVYPSIGILYLFSKPQVINTHTESNNVKITPPQHIASPASAPIVDSATPLLPLLPEKKIVKIEIPTHVEMPYQGSNAEYIILKQDGAPLSEEDFKTLAYPILSLQFPRTKATESQLSPEQLNALDSDEVSYINTQLNEKGMSAIIIPKTLYDLFYVSYRLDDAVAASKTSDKKMALKKMEEFRFPTASVSICKRSGNTFRIESVNDQEIHNEFSQCLNKSGLLTKVEFQLNQYILNFLKSYQISKHLNWELTLKLFHSLIDHIKQTFNENANVFHSLYIGQGFNYDDSSLNHALYKIGESLGNPKCQEALLKTLWWEYSQDAGIFTIYRGGRVEKDDNIKFPDKSIGLTAMRLNSLSFGQSWLISFENDNSGAGAIPLEYVKNGAQLME